MSTVMVVDDEERIIRFLTRSLTAEGHTVVPCGSGQGALDALVHARVDLILLDLVMAQGNGLQVLTELRQRQDGTPVIVLSGVTEVSARVQALDRGAVDFVSKPFHTAELIARVRRHLSFVPQQRSAEAERYLTAGGLRLDLDRRRVSVDGRELGSALSEREFALLAHLLRRRGEVCGREELLHDIWGLDFDPGSNVVEVCMRRLRGKVDELPVETVRGVGYCYVG